MQRFENLRELCIRYEAILHTRRMPAATGSSTPLLCIDCTPTLAKSRCVFSHVNKRPRYGGRRLCRRTKQRDGRQSTHINMESWLKSVRTVFQPKSFAFALTKSALIILASSSSKIRTQQCRLGSTVTPTFRCKDCLACQVTTT